MARELKEPPAYAVASVDHVLRLALLLQQEGSLTVSASAERLGVARSTAHRLLSMLVYRDFAVQDADRSYRAGPVLELAALSDEQVGSLYAPERYSAHPETRPDLGRLLKDLAAVRRTGAAVNLERSERGLSALGVPVHDPAGDTVAAVSLSIPTVRYQPEQVSRIVAALEATSRAISRELSV